jgi:hypothetical protein
MEKENEKGIFPQQDDITKITSRDTTASEAMA